MAQVGDMFAHVNPGRSDNPNEHPKPFVSIYTVVEVSGGKARLHHRTLSFDGSAKEYETWDGAMGIGRHDEKLR